MYDCSVEPAWKLILHCFLSLTQNHLRLLNIVKINLPFSDELPCHTKKASGHHTTEAAHLEL